MSFVLHKQYTLPEQIDDVYLQNGQIFALVPAVVGVLINDQNLDTIIHFYDYLGWKVLPQIITDQQGFYWLVKDKYNQSCAVFKVDLIVQKNVLLQQQAGNNIAYSQDSHLIPIDDFRKSIESVKQRLSAFAFTDAYFQTMLQSKSEVDNQVNSQPCPWYEDEEEQEQEHK